MAPVQLTELTGWDEIKELAGHDNIPSQGKAKAMASEKQAYAMTNLGNNIFNAQKHISQRLDTLNENLVKSSESTNKLSKKTFWLTVALVIATVVQAIAAVLIVIVSISHS